MIPHRQPRNRLYQSQNPRSSSCLQKQLQLATSLHLSELINMDTETAEAENTLSEQEAPRKSGRPSPIVMTYATNLTRLQNDLKDHVKGQYEFRNTRNGTRTITKEMTDYWAMKLYLEKNNLQYFIFSIHSENLQRQCNPSPSPRYASGIYFQQRWGLRLQCEAVDEHQMDKPMWKPSLCSLLH
jgi:hypothetical protein